MKWVVGKGTGSIGDNFGWYYAPAYGNLMTLSTAGALAISSTMTIRGTLIDSRITTGNQQIANTDGSNIYLGNPATTVYVEAGNLLFNIGGAKMPYHTGNYTRGTGTPSGGADGYMYVQYV
jgi:hypothetical protein